MNDEMRSRGQYNPSDMERLKPCPFCGTRLDDFPIFTVVPPVHTDEYLQWKLNNGHFLGTDNWFNARCIQCGATGQRGIDRYAAVKNWNMRNGEKV